MSITRRISIVGVAAAVATLSSAMGLAGCGSSTDDEARPESTPTPRAATPPASALEGTWRTDPVTVNDMTRTLREHDLGKWAGRFERNAPIPEVPTALILEIGEGDWDLSGEPEGRGLEEIDYDAQYETDGQRVVVSHERDSNTYGWSVRGDSLTLTWQRTTYGAYKGIPEEVFQRALYMTAKFRRTR